MNAFFLNVKPFIFNFIANIIVFPRYLFLNSFRWDSGL